MKILLKTKVLSGIFTFLFLINCIDFGGSTALQALPVLSELPKDEILRIEISDASQKIILQKEEGIWMMRSPEQGKADVARIRSLILNFRKSIPMDALIDTNNEEEYGLDGGNALAVQMWTSGVEPDVSFLLGNDAAQGSSFLRLSGEDSIYRARVGGRRRYAYSAVDWLSQQVIPLDINDIRSISVQRNIGESYLISKGDTAWEIAGVSSADLDQERISLSLTSLISLRIGERVERVEFQPVFSIQLETSSPSPFLVNVGEIGAGGAVVQVGEEFYRVASPALERFDKGKEVFLDRKLLSLQDRQLLDLVQYSSPAQKIILQQDLSNNFWNVLEPNNLDLDLREIFFMVNTLLSLEYIAPLPTGAEVALSAPHFSIVLRSLAGTTNELQIYQLPDNQYIVTTSIKDGFFKVSSDDIERIAKGFGQTIR